MNQDNRGITENAYLVLTALLDPSSDGFGLTNQEIIDRTGLSEKEFWQVRTFLAGKGYVAGTLGGLNGSTWAKPEGMEYFENLREKKRKAVARLPSEFRGLIHKVAVLGKDFYTLATIDDLFIFAGAASSWWQEPAQTFSSERITRVYGWVEGTMHHAPENIEKVIHGVALQMSENEHISGGDKTYLQRFVGLPAHAAFDSDKRAGTVIMPRNVERLLEVVIQNLPRAMFPLKHRRKGLPAFSFDNEYDVQALLHALLRPWVKDIRAEEYTPSYVGTSTRIDFLLADYDIVIEVKYVRDASHAKKIGDELIIDIAHYGAHEKAKQLWVVVYDREDQIPNPGGLVSQLDGNHERQGKTIQVRTFIL